MGREKTLAFCCGASSLTMRRSSMLYPALWGPTCLFLNVSFPIFQLWSFQLGSLVGDLRQPLFGQGLELLSDSDVVFDLA